MKNTDSLTDSVSEENSLNRRGFLKMSAVAGAALTVGSTAQAFAQTSARVSALPLNAAPILRGERPRAPYIVWSGAEFFNRNPDIYSNMTLDGGGYLDPRVAAVTGKQVLDVIDGTQTTNARGAYYWKNPTDKLRRTRSAYNQLPAMSSAGLAVMSWGGPLPEKKPDNEKWMLEGLREGKKANPNCFVAAWVNEPNQAMFEAGHDGLVDLFIIEGFTHRTPDELQTGIVTWENAMARCDAFKAAGLLSKTIFGFGNINGNALMDGKKLSKVWLADHMREVKNRFPEMPGVAFRQTSTTRSDGTIDIIKSCNILCAELWPNTNNA